MNPLFYHGIGKRNGSDETSGNGLLRLVGELPVRAEGFPANGNTHESTPGNTYEDTPGSIPGGIHESLSCSRETPQSLRDSSPFRRSSFVGASFRAMYRNASVGRIFSLLFFFLFLLIGHVEKVQAQTRIVTVTVTEKYDGNKTRPGVKMEVYGFYDKTAMDALLKKWKDTKDGALYSPQEGKDYDDGTITNNEGFCELELPVGGYVVARPSMGGGGSPVYAKVPNNLQVNLIVNVDVGEIMEEVVKEATRERTNQPVPGIRMGNRKILGPFPFFIFEKEAKANARMALAPIVTTLETGDTVMFGRPFVKDGTQYHASQLRRTGFDLSKDPLESFRSKSLMRTREIDSVTIYLELYPIQPEYHYRVNATRWFEDFNAVYLSDSVCLDEGYDKEPMRFLDYEDAMLGVPIERERYERIGKREMRNDHRKLDLKFLPEQAQIDPSDSASFAQLNQLKEDLARYVRDGGGISSATIHGQASPDGGMAINERLCRERAQYLRQEIGRATALQGAQLKVTANVAPWKKVGDLLFADSLKAEAEQVYQIVNSTSNTSVQEQRIKQLPIYPMISERILPRLRVVDFEFYYFVNRVKPREEIWEDFQKDPEYRAGKKQQPYEFYQLFDMVKDPAALEVLAKAAMKSVKDIDGQRAWPLAAYELAQCYLKRDTCDTLLLKPYLNWNLAANSQPTDIEGRPMGWYNDEAIVATQVAMYCQAKDYYMADSLALKLPDSPDFHKLKMFVRCLRGGWSEPDVRKVVEASSPWNKVIVYAAQNSLSEQQQALDMLKSDSLGIDPNDARTLYMISQMRFRLEADKIVKKFSNVNFELQEDLSDLGFGGTGYGMDDLAEEMNKKVDWGYPMVRCCLKDSSYVQVAMYDGYFNEAFRKSFKTYWDNMQKRIRSMRAKAVTSAATDSLATDSATTTIAVVEQVAGTTVGMPETAVSSSVTADSSTVTVPTATALQPGTMPAATSSETTTNSSVKQPAAPVTFPENPVPATVPATVPAY